MQLSSEMIDLVLRFTFNAAIAYIIIKVIYYRDFKNNDFIFSYFMFNTLIFFFAYILGGIDINMGFAFGLFAVFAMLRYRTNPIPIKEMTYLFIVITVGVINALSGNMISLGALLFTNFSIVLLTFILENYWQNNLFINRTIDYENIENIKPENHEKLLADLEERTGLDIIYYDIQNINFLRDTVKVKIYTKK
ncbi:MAG: DUF4956 domain-containing protein [Flavobacteriales bacterium]|jgi:hypothetical protein|nr:DUF4956 domain-containing protein [Flavobacteriales bacterium]|tara:strand:- start:601 stop:1179 length:579 start_codon:yes stop_codon:yes gene_type:complete